MSTIVKDGRVIHLPECFGKLHSFTDTVCKDCPVNSDCENATTAFNRSLVEVVDQPEVVGLQAGSPAAERLLSALASEQVCYKCNGRILEYGSSGSVSEQNKAVHNSRKGFRHACCPVTTVSTTPIM